MEKFDKESFGKRVFTCELALNYEKRIRDLEDDLDEANDNIRKLAGVVEDALVESQKRFNEIKARLNVLEKKIKK
jgi:uncharacterized coiled-coil protein SlyX